ncbi:TPA: hypothetical protein ACH3X3_009240 [Trebouxia sp. C0006]
MRHGFLGEALSKGRRNTRTDAMDDNALSAGLVRARSGVQHERDSGFLSGLVDLLPRLGYRGLLPSVSFARQEQRPLLPIAAQTRQHSRAASQDSNTAESVSSTQDSTEQQLQAEQSEVSTSGRDGQIANQQTDSPAAAAERHRIGSANSFDLQLWAQWVEKTAPYLVLLLVVFVYAHVQGLAVFAWLSLVLYKANQALRKQVALKADYNRLHCISLAGLLTCHVPIVLLCLRSEHLWQRFVLRDPSPVPMFWTALFWVTTVDLLTRHMGMVVKLGVIMMCPCSSAEGLRRRAQSLTCAENLTLLYRALLPVPVWYKFFEGSGMGMVLCAMTTGVYLLLKCGMLVERATVLMASARAIVRQEAAYGQYAKPEEVMESGNQCAICQVSICLLDMFSCFGMHAVHLYLAC